MSRRVWLLTLSKPSDSTLPRTRCKGANQASTGATATALAASNLSRNDTFIPFKLSDWHVADQNAPVSSRGSFASRSHLLRLGRVPAKPPSQPPKRTPRISSPQLFLLVYVVGGRGR